MTNNIETFEPVKLNEYYLKLIVNGLKKEIRESLFKPIFDLLGSNNTLNINNDKRTLLSALHSGRIYYENGAFKSRKPFSNAVAFELEQLGAKYKYGAYYIPRNMLPVEIDNALAFIAAKEATKVTALNGLLIKLASNIDKSIFVKSFIENAVIKLFTKLQTDLLNTTKDNNVPIIDLGYEIPEIKKQDSWFEAIDAQHKYDDTYDKKTGTRISLKDKDKNKDKAQPPATSYTGDNKNEPLGDNDNTPDKEDTGSDTTGSEKDKGSSGEDKRDKNKDQNKDKGQDDKTKNKPSKSDTDLNTGSKDKKEKNNTFFEDNFNKSRLNKETDKIAQDYIYNMDYWVKNWKSKEIAKMRKDVVDLVKQGARTDTLTKYFEKRWGIATRKAEFLARNESGIASSVLKATHYQNLGCEYFMWLRSTSIEKRELHLEYAKPTGNQYGINGTNIFAFNDPPIIEQVEIKDGAGKKTAIPKPDGQRGLPQQTYNCNCNLVGIKDPKFYENRKKIENAKRNIFTKIKYAIENSKQRNNNPWRYRRFREGQEV